MSNVAYNNLTSGLVTPKLAGNYTSSIYHSGCAVLENFSVMLQGGITRRPPVESVHDNAGVRIIPFIVDVDEVYLLELKDEEFKLWEYKDGEFTEAKTTTEGINREIPSWSPWTASEALEVQFAQSSDVLYLVQGNHRPMKLFRNNNNDWQLAYVKATLTRFTDIQTGDKTFFDKMSEREGDEYADDEPDIFCTEGNYPTVVAFHANRLWFACTSKHKIRYWASKPFEHESFAFYEMVKVEQTGISTEQITQYVTATEFDKNVSYEKGATVVVNGYKFRAKEHIEPVVDEENFDTSKWEFIGTEDIPMITTYTQEPVVTEDCALRFDASGNDAIRWISAKDHILVGTASGEYVIPGTVNGINYQLQDISSYGSQKGLQAVQANGEVIYVQSGGRRLRSESVSSEGYSNLDLTYQCDMLLPKHGGVKRMAWRRVPEPTLYVVLGDGTLGVLFYDRGYGLCAWSHWTFPDVEEDVEKGIEAKDAKIKDVCVLDTPTGQEVFFLVSRMDGTSLEHLRTIDASDAIKENPDGTKEYFEYKDLGDINYKSVMVTNPYEYNSSSYGSTLGKKKRVRAIVCRLYKSKAFMAGYGEKYMHDYVLEHTEGEGDVKDVEVLLDGGYSDFLQMRVESVEDKALTLLAFSIDLEAER